jgi:tetratricopeptide (TPR) repeat protein
VFRRVILLLPLVLCSCMGGSRVEQRADAGAAFDAGIQAADAGNHQAAVEQLTVAIEEGAISPDFYVEALLRRAECQTQLGNLDAALADLAAAEPGAPDLQRLHEMRAYIYRKQGNRVEAGKAAQAAQQTVGGS